MSFHHVRSLPKTIIKTSTWERTRNMYDNQKLRCNREYASLLKYCIKTVLIDVDLINVFYETLTLSQTSQMINLNEQILHLLKWTTRISRPFLKKMLIVEEKKRYIHQEHFKIIFCGCHFSTFHLGPSDHRTRGNPFSMYA